MQHSDEVREAVVRKALAGKMTQDEIAEAHGVSRSSVQQWTRMVRAGGGVDLSNKDRRPREWSAQERFTAVVETHGLDEQELGVWCRRHGLHSHELEQWRRDAVSGSAGVQGSGAGGEESKRLRRENAQLRKELNRKDKALAETTALLVLQKKARILWGEDEDR